MDKTVIGALIGVGSAIIGAVLGTWLTKKYSFQLVVRHEFIKAAASFRYLLEEDVERLKILPADEKFFEGMEKRFDPYEKSMIGLKINLPAGIVSSFEQAWEKYKYAGHDKQHAKHVHLSTFHLVDGEEKAKQTILDNIKELAKFCDPDYVFK